MCIRDSDDVVRPGMLHACFVRSPYARARIEGIDATEALALPGVHAVFTADLAHQATRRLALETGLRRAIENKELFIYYQPQIKLENHTVVGAEALVRWHCNGELVEPVVFIPVAEQSNLIVAIDEWVLGEACRQIVAWDQDCLLYTSRCV